VNVSEIREKAESWIHFGLVDMDGSAELAALELARGVCALHDELERLSGVLVGLQEEREWLLEQLDRQTENASVFLVERDAALKVLEANSSESDEVRGSYVAAPYHPDREGCDCESKGVPDDGECLHESPCWISRDAYNAHLARLERSESALPEGSGGVR
jgi:hypothetical protein